MNGFTIRDALALLATQGGDTATLFSHGTLDVMIYKPDQTDIQRPHARDEVYVIATGAGTFEYGGERRPVACGDVLFAEAGAEHRFVDFSDDFSTWVFFYGPEGGE